MDHTEKPSSILHEAQIIADPRERLFHNLKRSKIPGLDGVRGVAALAVVAAHGITPRAPGAFGVLMFFILSGLLITWLLLLEDMRSGTVDLKSFYIRRAFRLLPPLFVLILWEVVTQVPKATTGGMLAAALYCANYYVALGGVALGMGHTWSLAVEEHFYMIWPVVFRAARWRGRLVAILILVAGLSAVYKIVIRYYVSPLYAANATEANATGIVTGCILALWIWKSHKTVPHFIFRPMLAVISLIAVLGLTQTSEPVFFWAYLAAVPLLAILLLQSITYEWRVLERNDAAYLRRPDPIPRKPATPA